MTFTHLDYNTHKKCIQVDKFFQSVTNHKSVGSIMFQEDDPPNDASFDIAKLKFHPAFELVSNECHTDIKHICFIDYSSLVDTEDFREWALIDTSAASEFATEPPLQSINLQVHDRPRLTVHNNYAVTVLQVMKGLCRIFGKKTLKRLQAQGLDIYRDLMGDHTGWTGFDSKTKDSRGQLQLGAEWFDS